MNFALDSEKKERGTVTPRKTSRLDWLNIPAPDADGSIEVHVDYYRGSFSSRSEDFRRAIICRLMGNDSAQVIKNSKFTDYQGDRGYENKMVGAHGQSVYWRKAESGYDIRIELPGTFFASYTTLESFVRQLQRWQKMGINSTRIDFALTDKNKYIKWEQWRDAESNGCLANVSKHSFILSTEAGGKHGVTLGIGSRRSDKYVRVYETSVKHGFAANRIEVEFKGDLCRHAVKELIRNYSNFRQQERRRQDWRMQEVCASSMLNKYVARVVCGSLDVISRDSIGSNGSTAHAPRLEWWTRFVSLMGGSCRLFVEPVKPSIAMTSKWIQRQVSKSLGILRQGLGNDVFNTWLQTVIDKGAAKIKPTDGLALGILYEYGTKALDEMFEMTTQT